MFNGLEVRYLVNMITEDGKRLWTHGQSAEVLQMQSQTMGIPLPIEPAGDFGVLAITGLKILVFL